MNSDESPEFKTLHGKFEQIDFDEKYADEFNAKFTKREEDSQYAQDGVFEFNIK